MDRCRGDARRDRSRRLILGQDLQTGFHRRWWSAEELKLLGKVPEDEVARKIGQTVEAVRIKRERLHIPNTKDLGRWTVEAVAQLGTVIDAAVARRIGRTT
jgi:hypothetical protein